MPKLKALAFFLSFYFDNDCSEVYKYAARSQVVLTLRDLNSFSAEKI